MYKYLFFILLIFLCSISFGQDFPGRPNPPKLVNDFSNILDERSELALEQKLVNYNNTTSTQIAVVTINSINGYDIGDYSFRLAENWGIGTKGKDNGVLLLVAMQERKMFIATGYGLEGVIPDAVAKRIIENYLKPNFRNNNYYKGIDDATSVVMGLANGEFTADQIAGEKVDYSRLLYPLVMVVFFVLISYSRFKSARGSHLGGRNMSFLTYMLMMSSMGGRGGRSYGNFSSGRGSFGGGGFGGFGGGGFGGGGAGGSW